jgi:hypothetical protein
MKKMFAFIVLFAAMIFALGKGIDSLIASANLDSKINQIEQLTK